MRKRISIIKKMLTYMKVYLPRCANGLQATTLFCTYICILHYSKPDIP